MLALLVVAAVAAAPLDAVVATDGRQKLVKAIGGKPLDATAVHAYLYRVDGIFPLRDFDQFRAAPMPGWPAALNAVWTTTLTYCRETAGPPPWRDNLATVVDCGERAQNYLWQAFLTHRKVRTVYRLDVRAAGLPEATVKGSRYAANAADTLEVTRTGPSADAAALTDEVIAALVAGTGEPGTRPFVTTPLVGMTVGTAAADPFAQEPVATGAIALDKTCAALPAGLNIGGGSRLAESIAGRWKESAPAAKAPPARCELKVSTREENGMMGPMTVVTAALKCGKATASASVAREAVKPPLEMLTDKLVPALAARYCK